MKLQIAPVLVLLSLAPLSASAETAAERRACTNDAFNFCAQYIPSRGRVAACLARNIDRISHACRTVMESYNRPGSPNGRGPSPARF
jgi:hypothetical protein